MGLPVVVGLAFPAGAQQGPPRPSRIHTYREVRGQALHAHLFLPPGHPGSEPAHAILLFHGGGWSAGAPEWVFPAARRFADSGLVAIAVQYRLANGDVTPIDAVGDACAALDWTRKQRVELGLSGRIAGYGVSAGGHLIAATATLGCPADAPAGKAKGPDALLLWSPALDLVDDAWFASRLKGRATAASLSPARHVGPQTPPTSIVQGERDTLTPPSGAMRFCAQVRKTGGTCDLHVYPGVGHLLTRNLANQESDFDPDPKARADGIARHHEFLIGLGFVKAAR
jgi:acetyl esterase/lipase